MTVEFRSPRTPGDQMNTIQPFISELFSNALREVVSNRLRETFLSGNIPVKSLWVEYFGSAASAGDERFLVSVLTSRNQLMPASLAVASILSEICSKGIGIEEYKVARNSVLNGCLKASTNDAIVRQCVSAYLYGSDLASPAAKAKFFLSRNMSAKAETDLFNAYASALLSGMEAPSVIWTGNADDYDEWFWPVVFESAGRVVSALENLSITGRPVQRTHWPFGARRTRSRSSLSPRSLSPEVRCGLSPMA